MNEKIIMFPGNNAKNMIRRKSREKRRKQETEYQGAVKYPMHDDGEKEIKSGKSYSSCGFI